MWHQQKQSVTDGQQSDPHVALCIAGTTKIASNFRSLQVLQTFYADHRKYYTSGIFSKCYNFRRGRDCFKIAKKNTQQK